MMNDECKKDGVRDGSAGQKSAVVWPVARKGTRYGSPCGWKHAATTQAQPAGNSQGVNGDGRRPPKSTITHR